MIKLHLSFGGTGVSDFMRWNMRIRKAGGGRRTGPGQKRDKAAARRKALKNRDDEEKAKLFQEIMARIRMVTETRTQVELADFLGIRQSSVSGLLSSSGGAAAVVPDLAGQAGCESPLA